MRAIYWITTLDNIHCLLMFLIMLVIISIVYVFVTYSDDNGINKDRKRKIIKLSVLCLVIGVIKSFLPTTNQMFMIYGVGGSIDWIKENGTAQQLPHKVVEALDEFLEEYIKKEEDKK